MSFYWVIIKGKVIKNKSKVLFLGCGFFNVLCIMCYSVEEKGRGIKNKKVWNLNFELDYRLLLG